MERLFLRRSKYRGKLLPDADHYYLAHFKIVIEYLILHLISRCNSYYVFLLSKEPALALVTLKLNYSISYIIPCNIQCVLILSFIYGVRLLYHDWPLVIYTCMNAFIIYFIRHFIMSTEQCILDVFR